MFLCSKPKRPNQQVRCAKDPNIIFGIIERFSGNFILYCVKDRTQQTLFPIIQDHIKADSSIFKDKFSVYVNAHTNTSHLEQLGYNHSWVNHSKSFVDPVFKFINTNRIERLWRSLRAHVSHIKRAVPLEKVDHFLNSFMLKCLFGEDEFFDVMIVLRYFFIFLI